MSTATIREIADFHTNLGLKTRIKPGADPVQLQEAKTEAAMKDVLKLWERAHALGAPARLFEAARAAGSQDGAELIRSYIARASVFGGDPEKIMREMAGSLRVSQLLEQAEAKTPARPSGLGDLDGTTKPYTYTTVKPEDDE